MTDWKENESYFNIKCLIFIYKIYRVYIKDGTAKTYEDITLKSRYYPHLNVHTYGRTTKQNKE